MYEKFGEFDSAEELNRAAAAQKAEGDQEALKTLAKENGIDEDDMTDYWDGTVETFCTPLTAAIGKIEVEAESLGLFGAFENWKSLLIDEAIKNEDLQKAIRKKGKDFIHAVAAVMKQESASRKVIPKPIAKAAGLPDNVPMSTMTARDEKKTLLAYYLGEKK